MRIIIIQLIESSAVMSLKFLRINALMGVFVLSLLPGMSFADTSQRLVQMLDYIGVDYPPTVSAGRVIDDIEYAEMVEFSHELKNLLAAMPEHPARGSFDVLAEQIKRDIQNRVPGAEVAAHTQEFKTKLIEAYSIVVGPAETPDMSSVRVLFEANCAACHGLTGYGDGPQAAGMEPAPSNFHDMERQYSRSVYDLYNTISLGVNGTSMTGYTQLSEEQRWALAFMVSGFSATEQQLDQGKYLWQQGKLQVFSSHCRI